MNEEGYGGLLTYRRVVVAKVGSYDRSLWM